MRLPFKKQLHSLLAAGCALGWTLAVSAQDSGLIELTPEMQLFPNQLTRQQLQFSPIARPHSENATAPVAYSLHQESGNSAILAEPTLQFDVQLADDSESPVDDIYTNEGANQAERPLSPLQSRQLALPARNVDLSIAGLGTGALPESAAAKRTPEALSYPRPAAFKCVHWRASQLNHYPLRFEDAMLERHGHVRFGHLQPLAAGAKFFATIPLLPYLNTLHSAHEPVYALGHYRPGSYAPRLKDTVPWDRNAAVVEALYLAGFFWAMPL